MRRRRHLLLWFRSQYVTRRDISRTVTGPGFNARLAAGLSGPQPRRSVKAQAWGFENPGLTLVVSTHPHISFVL